MKVIKIEKSFAIILLAITAVAMQNGQRHKSTLAKESVQIYSMKINKAEMENERYDKEGIEAEYPQIVSGGNEEELSKWNQIIQEDFQKIIAIYSFNPYLDLRQTPTGEIPTILKIKYEIKLNTDELLSITYTADYNSPYSAYPTQLLYTTNINKTKSERLKLPDVVKLNKDFVKEFRTWDYKTVDEGNLELNKAIKDYVNNISDEDLLNGFQTADIIGSGNTWGIYSYLTPDRLVISIGVPNYIGDHVEFERDYKKLGNYLKNDIR
ncbi:MAG: hypothetical protein PHF63_11200 [Herbinix sp.]|nr:hypothetical protein [Herbinix sp.]